MPDEVPLNARTLHRLWVRAVEENGGVGVDWPNDAEGWANWITFTRLLRDYIRTPEQRKTNPQET